MYRIEVAPGEETVFRTIEELAVGIRNGVITSRSRVYHNASQKWLPIGLHPHYKKAMELPAASAAQPAAPTPPPAAPRIKPRAEPAAEPPRAATVPVARASAARIPPPVTSPVVAMQQEVLRDLPVVAIPEPPAWTRPAPEPAPRPLAPAATRTPPPPPQALQAQPTATVTYAPRVTVEPAPLPAAVEHHPEDSREARPTARRAPRAGGRPFLLLGAAAFLVVAAHFALTATRSAPPDAGADPTDTAPEPASEMSSDEEVYSDDAIDPAEPAPRVSSAPARVPMTPGPAFAGSVPLRPGSDAAAPTATAPLAGVSAGSLAQGPSPAAATAAIAPPPVALDLALPPIAADSLMPKRSGDTMAMKKILRALNGATPAEPSTAP